jgi:hypothetical protein
LHTQDGVDRCPCSPSLLTLLSCGPFDFWTLHTAACALQTCPLWPHYCCTRTLARSRLCAWCSTTIGHACASRGNHAGTAVLDANAWSAVRAGSKIALREVLASAAGCAALRSLDLSGCLLNSACMRAFGSVLQQLSALKCLDVNNFGPGTWNLPEVNGRFMAGMPVAAAVCLSCLTGIKQTVHEAYVGLQVPHTCGTSDGSSGVMKLHDLRDNARQPMHTESSTRLRHHAILCSESHSKM